MRRGKFDRFMRHEVTVQSFNHVVNDDMQASESPAGPPVTVWGLMSQVESREANARGMTVDTAYQFWTRSVWPGGPLSVIRWGDRTFEQDGAARETLTGLSVDSTTVFMTETTGGV